MRRIALLTVVLLAVILVSGGPPSPTSGAKRFLTPVYTESLDVTHQLIGPLGLPLWEVMTVTANVETPFPKSYFDHSLIITSVNGIALRQPKRMPAKLSAWANIRELKPGQPLTLRAYQDGGMMGVPEQAMKEPSSYSLQEAVS